EMFVRAAHYRVHGMILAELLVIVQRGLAHVIVDVAGVDGGDAPGGQPQDGGGVQPGVPLCDVHVAGAFYFQGDVRVEKVFAVNGAESPEAIAVGVLPVDQDQRV